MRRPATATPNGHQTGRAVGTRAVPPAAQEGPSGPLENSRQNRLPAGHPPAGPDGPGGQAGRTASPSRLRNKGRQTAPPRSRSFCRGELHLDRGGAARQGQALRNREGEPSETAKSAAVAVRSPRSGRFQTVKLRPMTANGHRRHLTRAFTLVRGGAPSLDMNEQAGHSTQISQDQSASSSAFSLTSSPRGTHVEGNGRRTAITCRDWFDLWRNGRGH